MSRKHIENAGQIARTRLFGLKQRIEEEVTKVSLEELNQAYDAVISSNDPDTAYQEFLATHGQEAWNRVIQNKVTAYRRRETMDNA